MPTYICKETLLRDLKLFEANDILSAYSERVTPVIAASGMLLSAIRTIEQMPEAPVAPVKVGKWKTHKNDPLDIYVHTCDVCWMELWDRSRVGRKYKYCPFCGAKLEADPQEDPKEE